MNITKLPNGNLKMSLGDELKRFHKGWAHMKLYTSAMEIVFIRTWLQPLGYKEIKPEHCGALTDAPLITDGTDVWGYMDYQVSAFLEALAEGKSVVWQKG